MFVHQLKCEFMDKFNTVDSQLPEEEESKPTLGDNIDRYFNVKITFFYVYC
jgi:hypothetical protein